MAQALRLFVSQPDGTLRRTFPVWQGFGRFALMASTDRVTKAQAGQDGASAMRVSLSCKPHSIEVLFARGDALGLVEDLVEILRLEGARVVSLEDDDMLAERIAACRVLVVDVDLRDRDGIGLALRARRLRPDLDIVVTTPVRPSDLTSDHGELALVPEPLRVELAPLLHDSRVVWLAKPFDVERLLRVVFPDELRAGAENRQS